MFNLETIIAAAAVIWGGSNLVAAGAFVACRYSRRARLMMIG